LGENNAKNPGNLPWEQGEFPGFLEKMRGLLEKIKKMMKNIDLGIDRLQRRL